MKGNIVELKFWRSEWASQVYDWYESGEYPVFFRNISNPVSPEAFLNYPLLVGNLSLGVFAPKQEGLLGLVTVYDYDQNSRVASCGVMIRKDSQNLHLGTDAFLTIFKYLFETKDLRKISIQFSGDDQTIIHMLHFMGKFLDSKITKDSPIEASPYFEGRRKKQIFINGKYQDLILAACFKKQFETMMEKYHGR